jgi:hypothetical protein
MESQHGRGVFLGQADSTSHSNCFDGSCSGEIRFKTQLPAYDPEDSAA